MRCAKRLVVMDEINPGIRKTVALLNANGFKTTDSGDGETHDYACDRDVGYVVVKVLPHQDLVDTANRIHDLLVDNGISFKVDLDGVQIQASYSPVDKYQLVDIHNIHDRMLGGS